MAQRNRRATTSSTGHQHYKQVPCICWVHDTGVHFVMVLPGMQLCETGMVQQLKLNMQLCKTHVLQDFGQSIAIVTNVRSGCRFQLDCYVKDAAQHASCQ